MGLLTLEEYIDKLSEFDPDTVVETGYVNPHSWRGAYECLSFEPKNNVTISDMISAAEEAIDSTYEGWKGGSFEMDLQTLVYFDYEGSCSCDDPEEILQKMVDEINSTPNIVF